MNHLHWIRSLLAAFLVVHLGCAKAEEQTIVVPGEGWRITFDAPKLTQRPFPPNIRGGIFSGNAGLFQLTFFVDRPWCDGPDSHDNLYACFQKGMAGNRYVVPGSIRGNTTRYGVQTMSFARVPTASGVATNMGMHLLFAKNGKWADFHASFAMPTPADVEALAAIMESIRVEDEQAPAPVPAEGGREPNR
jgi:hypothetical protein